MTHATRWNSSCWSGFCGLLLEPRVGEFEPLDQRAHDRAREVELAAGACEIELRAFEFGDDHFGQRLDRRLALGAVADITHFTKALTGADQVKRLAVPARFGLALGQEKEAVAGIVFLDDLAVRRQPRPAPRAGEFPDLSVVEFLQHLDLAQRIEFLDIAD